MPTTKHINSFLWLLVTITLLSACISTAPLPPAPMVTKYPLKFDVAVRTLINDLFQQVNTSPDQSTSLDQTKMVLDPFVDANSGDVVKVSQHIEQIILEEVRKHFKNVTIDRINSQNIREAQWVINGVIDFEDYQVGETQPPDKYYRMSASLISLSNAKIMANSQIWISERELDYTPVATYRDSPLYLKDQRLDSAVETAKTPAGKPAQKEYYNTLDTTALLAEANQVYEKSDFEKALQLFTQAAQRADGQIMKTYAGLYETNLKLKQQSAAEQAFTKLLEVSIKETQKLNMKFLFKVNSDEFIEEPSLRQEYQFWLQQITKYFRNSNQCFQVVGHCSHSGSESYNDQLSLSRANKVLQLMASDFPEIKQRSKAIGKGFRENLVGSGTDDARDAIDRRVEMVVVECEK